MEEIVFKAVREIGSSTQKSLTEQSDPGHIAAVLIERFKAGYILSLGLLNRFNDIYRNGGKDWPEHRQFGPSLCGDRVCHANICPSRHNSSPQVP